jgi:hypothetical protein
MAERIVVNNKIMRKITIQLLMVMTTILIGVSCTKDKGKIIKDEIDEKNLTPCPEKASCQYLFTEDADLNEAGSGLITGPYRLFWADIQTPGVRTTLYIKAPMEGKTFSFNKQAILDGKVKLIRSCAACLMTPFRLIEDGYVNGINLRPDKQADQTRWLLEAEIILEAIGQPAKRDTLHVKQYFDPNFVFN